VPATYHWQIDSTPLAVTSITFSSVTRSSAFLSWQTNQPANSQLEYATSSTFTNSQHTAVDASYVTSHAMTLTGLLPNTLYFVRAISVDRDGRTAVSAPVSFRTLRN